MLADPDVDLERDDYTPKSSDIDLNDDRRRNDVLVADPVDDIVRLRIS
jgi:hypothetical protein